MQEWVDIATAIAGADLIPWVQFHGWHTESCNRSDAATSVDKLGPWVALQLQPEKHEFFPSIIDSMKVAQDTSLQPIDAKVICFLII